MTTLSNPYQDPDGSPRVKKSVIAFLDLLGFAGSVTLASESGRAQQHLENLKSALTEASDHFHAEERFVSRMRSAGEATFRVKMFTDNLIIGDPIFDDGEGDLGSILFKVGWYQYLLAQRGFFVRGGITVGDIYMDDDIVYGSGLLDAYEAEKTLARDPRVVLDDKVTKMALQHLNYYDAVDSSPHDTYLLVDSDDQLFVNYLAIPLDGAPPNQVYFQGLDKHRDLIQNRLQEFADRPTIWTKYAWAAGYHNLICNSYESGPEHTIAEKFLRRSPQRLAEVYSKRRSGIYKGPQLVAKYQPIK